MFWCLECGGGGLFCGLWIVSWGVWGLMTFWGFGGRRWECYFSWKSSAKAPIIRRSVSRDVFLRFGLGEGGGVWVLVLGGLFLLRDWVVVSIVDWDEGGVSLARNLFNE